MLRAFNPSCPGRLVVILNTGCSEEGRATEEKLFSMTLFPELDYINPELVRSHRPNFLPTEDEVQIQDRLCRVSRALTVWVIGLQLQIVIQQNPYADTHLFQDKAIPRVCFRCQPSPQKTKQNQVVFLVRLCAAKQLDQAAIPSRYVVKHSCSWSISD